MNAARVTEASGVSAGEAIIDKSFATRDGYLEISPVFSDNAVRDISVAAGLGEAGVLVALHALQFGSAYPRWAAPPFPATEGGHLLL